MTKESGDGESHGVTRSFVMISVTSHVLKFRLCVEEEVEV